MVDWYSSATQLNKKPQDVQAASFMPAIGSEVLEIFNNFNSSGDQQKDVAFLKTKFEASFTPKTNISFERYNLFKMVQKENGVFDEFPDNITHMLEYVNLGHQTIVY